MVHAKSKLWLLGMGWLALSAWPRELRACEFSEYDVSGILLSHEGWSDAAQIELPRNAALLFQQLADPAAPVEVGTDARGEPLSVLLEPVRQGPPGQNVYRSVEPLPVGAELSSKTVADYVDESPPTAPRVLGGAVVFNDGTGACGGNSCGDYTDLSLEIELSEDDHLRGEQLVYAVYLGTTRERAATAVRPDYVLRATGNQLWALVPDRWTHDEAYVSLSALDLAGNESPRSEPVKVGEDDGACSLSPGQRRAGAPLVLFAAAAAFALLRRQPRRMRQR
jgi:hypothetical protein